MASSAITRSSPAPARAEPAAEVVARRLSHAAEALAVADPTELLGDLLAATFSAPATELVYSRNELQPGSLPLECSFSELTPGALRIDLEPFGPGVAPAERRRRAAEAARRLVARHLGGKAGRAFEAAPVPAPSAAARFGAFVGAAFGPSGLAEVTVYYELGPRLPRSPSPRVARVARALGADVPGLSPHLLAISTTRTGIRERLYLRCEQELRLLGLERPAAVIGAADRFPALVASTLELTGGAFVVPARSAIVGLRESSGGVELKLELLRDALPGGSRELAGRVRQLLVRRPESLRAFDRWSEAIGAGPDGPDLGVVSVRLAPALEPLLNVYARLPWLRQTT